VKNADSCKVVFSHWHQASILHLQEFLQMHHAEKKRPYQDSLIEAKLKCGIYFHIIHFKNITHQYFATSSLKGKKWPTVEISQTIVYIL